jgi:hypothetical protein
MSYQHIRRKVAEYSLIVVAYVPFPNATIEEPRKSPSQHSRTGSSERADSFGVLKDSRLVKTYPASSLLEYRRASWLETVLSGHG